jgi:transcription initiation factor TFIIIB Brf1 subunit/transcription initiation factor TFIIB
MITCPVCGDDFLPAYPSQEHCSTDCRKSASKKPPKNRRKAPGFEDDQRTCRVTGCNERKAHDHHVVKQQHLDDYGGDPADPRNALALCHVHHERHHKAKRRIRLSELRPENLEFARELLGDYADDYIAREYDVTG